MDSVGDGWDATWPFSLIDRYEPNHAQSHRRTHIMKHDSPHRTVPPKTLCFSAAFIALLLIYVWRASLKTLFPSLPNHRVQRSVVVQGASAGDLITPAAISLPHCNDAKYAQKGTPRRRTDGRNVLAGRQKKSIRMYLTETEGAHVPDETQRAELAGPAGYRRWL